jgi:hypothetical protein
VEAYHGTPHRFEPEVKVRNINDGFEFFRPRPADLKVSPGLEVVKDYPLGRFRTENRGTGSGGELYGAGIYTAEAPAVSRPYRTDIVPAGTYKPTIGGLDANQMWSQLIEQADRLPTAQGQPLYDRASLIEDLIHTGDTLDVDAAIARGYGGYTPELVDWYKSNIQSKWDAPGALYKLNLDVDPNEMLAWNDPIAQQPYVRNALGKLMQQYEIPESDLYGKYPLTGADLYNKLRFNLDVRPQVVSDALTDAGLSGIRYADVGSGPGGTNSQNYVIMNPDLIEIMKRYNMGGKVEVNG